MNAVRESCAFTFVLLMASPSDASTMFKFVCHAHNSFDVDSYLGCFILRTNASWKTHEHTLTNRRAVNAISSQGPRAEGQQYCFAVCVNKQWLLVV